MELIRKILDRLLVWIKDVLPSVTAVGSLIYNYMLGRIQRMRKRAERAEMESELLENELDVYKDTEDKSDRDVILDVANGGDDDKGS